MEDIITVNQRFVNNLVAPYQFSETFGLDKSRPAFGYKGYGDFYFYPTNHVTKSDFQVIEKSNVRYLVDVSAGSVLEVQVGKTVPSFLSSYLRAKFLKTINFAGGVDQNVLVVGEALGSGFEFEISEDDYNYFLDALPPAHMGATYRSRFYDYGFREGEDAITHFRRVQSNGQYFAVRGDEYALEQRIPASKNTAIAS